jgi:hypothetical protein
MKRKSLYNVLLLTVVAFLFLPGCSKEDVLSDKLVLKINDVGLTEYEYDRNLAKYLAFLRKTELNDSEKDAFNKSIFDDALLTAHAYENGYDTNQYVNKNVDVVSNFIMTKPNGYLWKKTVLAGLMVTDEEIADALTKSDHVYYLEILTLKKKHPTDTALNPLLNEIKTVDDFKALSEKLNNNQSATLQTTSGRWPLPALYEGNEQLTTLSEGSLSQPVETIIGNIIYVVFKKEKINATPTEAIRQELKFNINTMKEGMFLRKQEKAYLKNCKPHFNESALSHYANGGRRDSIKTPQISLAEYIVGSTKLVVSNRDLEHFIKHYPQTPSVNIRSINDLKATIHQLMNMEYRLLEARKIDLFNDRKFVLEKNNFKNKLILEQYLKDSIASSVVVTDNEVDNYYTSNPSFFIEPAEATFSVFNFKNESDAMRARGIIEGAFKAGNVGMLKAAGILKGLTLHIPTKTMSRLDTDLPEDIFNTVYSLQVGQVANAIPINNAYAIYIKINETGGAPLALRFVKQGIFDRLKTEKIVALKNKRLEKLQARYKAEINDTDTYIDSSLKNVRQNIAGYL